MIELTDRLVHTPGGLPVVFTCRDGTNDGDLAVGLNVWNGLVIDEYRMTGRSLSGWAMDVGAHIGAAAIPLAMDHPDLHVIAVEAVPENADLLRENAVRNRVSDRITVVNASAAAPGTSSAVCHYGYRRDPSANDGYLTAHRFIAETWGSRGEPEFAPVMDAVSLDDLLERFGISDLAFLKIDCEGCEWAFLDTPAVSKVQTIVGEYHGGITGVENPKGRIADLLGSTHDLVYWSEEPVIGLFEATRRG